MTLNLPGDSAARFWSKVDQNGPIPERDCSLGHCWLWTGGTSGGYGILSLWPDPPKRTHQVSWALHKLGPIPHGQVIRHRCDNRLCVNPAHLELGTRGDNNRDTHERGRWGYVPAGAGQRRIPKKLGAPRTPTLDRFWPKIDKDGPIPTHDPELGPCWLWTGGLDVRGYGKFFLPGRKRNAAVAKAHRVSYELLVGPIPSGLDILHRCDVRRCVNPDHLYPGTDADNMRDRDQRGRRAPPKGARNGRAKLTEEQVAEIRARSTGAWGEQTALAREYGVAQTTISGILRGVKWNPL